MSTNSSHEGFYQSSVYLSPRMAHMEPTKQSKISRSSPANLDHPETQNARKLVYTS
ncbi:hypothetical protein AWB67_03265 [Caballeronia terrestris]|uniref:Uncharacterized protein n=1 Tax=Caballeronia terrestris TaxID=1226301 RepID=A0A158J2Y0_9BURK|nr:hypothetical protein AWB67_03265 [Caballeronia terrestris]